MEFAAALDAGAGREGIVVRDAVAVDIPAIQSIYAHHVLNGVATFDEVPPTSDEFLSRWRGILGLGLPCLVAERRGGIAGYSYATPYRSRPAYRQTVEDAVYVAEGAQGKGVGRALLGVLIARCEAGPWRQMVAVISDTGNAASITLHERYRFHRVGTLKAVGYKQGRWVDTVIMQRPLGIGPDAPPDDRRHPDATP